MRFRSSGSWSGSASRTAIPARIGGPPRTVAGRPARIIGLGPTRRRAGAAVAVIRPLQGHRCLRAGGWPPGGRMGPRQRLNQMADASDPLSTPLIETARAALGRHEWRVAFDALSQADAQQRLDPAGLE